MDGLGRPRDRDALAPERVVPPAPRRPHHRLDDARAGADGAVADEDRADAHGRAARRPERRDRALRPDASRPRRRRAGRGSAPSATCCPSAARASRPCSASNPSSGTTPATSPLDGADLFVVLARSDRWGESSGPYQHLHATRLRAIETRRSVVVVSAGGLSAVVAPSGRIEQTSGWLEQNLLPTDVPLYRSSTFYMRHGDWVGRWALAGALLLYLAAAFIQFVRPRIRTRAA